MLRYVPIVIISCNYIFIQKKKKKKKEKKNEPYFGMGKNTKVMPQYPAIYLGKGRKSLHLKPYLKLSTSALSDLPPACNDLDKASMTHLKNCPKMYIFSSEFCTFPVTEGNEIWHIYFQFMTPARKLTHKVKFECF